MKPRQPARPRRLRPPLGRHPQISGHGPTFPPPELTDIIANDRYVVTRPASVPPPGRALAGTGSRSAPALDVRIHAPRRSVRRGPARNLLTSGLIPDLDNAVERPPVAQLELLNRQVKI